MARGRKAGCPMDVGDWAIQAKELAQAAWTTVGGLAKMSLSTASDTQDASAETDLFEEPLVTKRSVTLSFEGVALTDAATGAWDEGQALLREYALRGGCEADLDLRVADPWGHATVLTGVVEKLEDLSESGSGRTLSFDIRQVGEAEAEPYVQLTAIALLDGETPIGAEGLTFTEGGAAKLVTVAFTPADASNKRFRVSNDKRSVAAVSGIAEASFLVTPVGSGTATLTVTTVNGPRTASLAVTVTEAQ